MKMVKSNNFTLCLTFSVFLIQRGGNIVVAEIFEN